MTPTEMAAARQKAIQAVQGDPQQGVSKQVVPLYAGAVYHLYTYKVYSDVRLVFGVEYQTGFYGGDADNFTYPRYNIDVSMFRLYENDKPAQTPNYLKWSPKGSVENELVFTTGTPARRSASTRWHTSSTAAIWSCPSPSPASRCASGREEVDGVERRERQAVHKRTLRHQNSLKSSAAS